MRRPPVSDDSAALASLIDACFAKLARVQRVNGDVVAIGRDNDVPEGASQVGASAQHRRALAHVENRLAPLAQAAQMHRERLERREAHLRANAGEVAGPQPHVRLLDRASRRDEASEPALHMVHALEQRVSVACQSEIGNRSQRPHHREQVERTHLGLDEVDQVTPQPGVGDRAELQMVVVEKDHQQAHVVACRLLPRVVGRADGERLVAAGWRLARQADMLEQLHALDDAVLPDLEVVARQVGHRQAVAADDGHVHADGADADAKRRWLRRCGSGRRLLRGRPRRKQRDGKQATGKTGAHDRTSARRWHS